MTMSENTKRTVLIWWNRKWHLYEVARETANRVYGRRIATESWELMPSYPNFVPKESVRKDPGTEAELLALRAIERRYDDAREKTIGDLNDIRNRQLSEILDR